MAIMKIPASFPPPWDGRPYIITPKMATAKISKEKTSVSFPVLNPEQDNQTDDTTETDKTILDVF